jgi:hypothetical protein
MRLGFVNIYSYRPHTKHLMFIADMMKDDGHDVYFLTCDAGVSNCYSRQLKGSGKLVECSRCIAGGVRTFGRGEITNISAGTGSLAEEEVDNIALSSSCTLARTEADSDWNIEEVRVIRKSLHDPVRSVFDSAKDWISANALEGVICFNGRMELTQAVTKACEKLDIPFITHERPWFGHGIQLHPNSSCLALQALNTLVKKYRSLPLTYIQAKHAGHLIGQRFLQQNHLEWRLYNPKPESSRWPVATSTEPKVLIIPSSKNEFAGHPDWRSGWPSNTDALDDFFNIFSFDPKKAVLRCHPNWGERIGQVTGERSLTHYREWANRNGVHFIESESSKSTYDLIQQSDIVLVNGGSSAVEAGACGKQVICLGPSTYEHAGFAQTFNSKIEMQKNRLNKLEADDIRRKTLRFVYLRSKRHPQYVDYVRALDVANYEYFKGANPNRIVEMLKTGKLQPDDKSFSESEDSEVTILEMLKNSDWKGLAAEGYSNNKTLLPLPIRPRFLFRWIDLLRNKFSRGDR